MEYKGYVGSVEFSQEDEVFFGKVQGLRTLISYEGSNATELVNDFHDAVDDYLKLCEDEGKEPEKASEGSFNVRFSPIDQFFGSVSDEDSEKMLEAVQYCRKA